MWASAPIRTNATPPSRRRRRRRSRGSRIAPSDSAADARASGRLPARTRRCGAAGREREARPQYAFDVFPAWRRGRMVLRWGERQLSCGERSGNPRRSGAKADVTARRGRLACGALHELTELIRCEAAQHGNDAVVAAHGVEAERVRGEPDAGGREPTAADVAHDHAHAGDAVELAQHRDGVAGLEMMERLRADDDVDALGRDRERERVGTNRYNAARARITQERRAQVDAEGGDGAAARAPCLHHAHGNVADAGANVEERERVRARVLERAFELGLHGARAAEHGVRARHVRERTRAKPIVDVGIVENLIAAPALRRQKGAHLDVSARGWRSRRDSRAAGSPRSWPYR